MRTQKVHDRRCEVRDDDSPGFNAGGGGPGENAVQRCIGCGEREGAFYWCVRAGAVVEEGYGERVETGGGRGEEEGL